MRIVFEKKGGGFDTGWLDNLQDGLYIIDIHNMNPLKTEREFQKEYFSLVDAVVDYTGDTRYTIHNRFKKERNIETTKDFSLQDWVDFIDHFRWYCFKNLDLIL